MEVAAVSGLFERDRELAAVGELLEFARAGSGRVLLVLGPAGIGKTGLLAAVSGMARKGGFGLCEGVGGSWSAIWAGVLFASCLVGWWALWMARIGSCLVGLRSWHCRSLGSGMRRLVWMR